MKKNHVIIFLLLTFFSTNIIAQITFHKTYGRTEYNWAYSVRQTFDGGYIASGGSRNLNNPDNDAYIVKTDAYGDTLWTLLIAGVSDQDMAASVKQTTDSGFIVGGYTYDPLTFHYSPSLIRLNANGDTLWTKMYRVWICNNIHCSDVTTDVLQTSDGGFVITGRFETQPISGSRNVFLIKTDTVGNRLWSKVYESGTYCEPGYLVQTPDSGFLIAGWSNGSSLGDVYLIRTDEAGDTLWTRYFGGSSSDFAMSIEPTNDSGFVICGYTQSFGAGEWDIYLIKTDANGDTLWTRTYGGAGTDYGFSAWQTSDGGYIVSGRTLSFSTDDKVYLIKTDSLGNVLWSKIYGKSIYNYRNAVVPTDDGGYIIGAEYFHTDSLSSDLYLIKTDADGNSGCNEQDVFTIMGYADTKISSTLTLVANTALPSVNMNATLHNEGTVINNCLTQSVSEIEADDGIVIYPNPATDQFTISLNGWEIKNTWLKIVDITGRVIQEQEINSQLFIVNCSFGKGLYFVKVSDGEKVSDQKLIIR